MIPKRITDYWLSAMKNGDAVYEFRLPDVGEGLHEAEIGDWLVHEGETVGQDQPILEVETDKSVVELPAPIAGVIRQIAVPSGTLATVGDLLVVIEPLGKPKPASQPKLTDLPKPAAQAAGIAPAGQRILASPVARKMALELGIDLSNVQGSGPAGRIMTSDVQAAVGQKATKNDQQQTINDQSTDQPISQSPYGKALAAPAIRRMAQKKGVDLTLVNGSRENGRITLPDLQAHLAAVDEQKTTNDQRQTTNDKLTNRPSNQATKQPTTTRLPLRGLRRTIARRMTQAWQIPQVTSFEEVDATALVALRSVLKETAVSQNVRFTYMPLIIKIVLHALKQFPRFNASINMEAEEVLLHNQYHIGIAAATKAGLLVPVLRNADQLTLLETAQELARLGEAAKARTLTSEEAGGSTFTISNFGSYGGSIGTPILNPPEAAILGIGRLEKKAIVLAGDKIAVRTMLPLALTFDHRLIDGADSGAFMAHLRNLLEQPQRLFLNMR